MSYLASQYHTTINIQKHLVRCTLRISFPIHNLVYLQFLRSVVCPKKWLHYEKCARIRYTKLSNLRLTHVAMLQYFCIVYCSTLAIFIHYIQPFIFFSALNFLTLLRICLVCSCRRYTLANDCLIDLKLTYQCIAL